MVNNCPLMRESGNNIAKTHRNGVIPIIDTPVKEPMSCNASPAGKMVRDDPDAKAYGSNKRGGLKSKILR